MTTPTPEPNPLSMSREEREKLACRVRREYQGINVPIVEVHLTDLRDLIHAVLDSESDLAQIEKDYAVQPNPLSMSREERVLRAKEWLAEKPINIAPSLMQQLHKLATAVLDYEREMVEMENKMAGRDILHHEVEADYRRERDAAREELAAVRHDLEHKQQSLLDDYKKRDAAEKRVAELEKELAAHRSVETHLAAAESEIIRLAALDEIKSGWLKEMEEKFDILRDSFQHNVDVWDSVEERVRRLEDWLRRTDGLFKECFDRLSAIEARMGEVSDT